MSATTEDANLSRMARYLQNGGHVKDGTTYTAPNTRLAILRRHLAEVDDKIATYCKAKLRVEFKIWYYEEAKRLGGVAKLPPLDDLLEQYRKETGKSTDW